MQVLWSCPFSTWITGDLLAREVKLVRKEAHNKSTMCSLHSSLPCCPLSTSWRTCTKCGIYDNYRLEFFSMSDLFFMEVKKRSPYLSFFSILKRTQVNKHPLGPTVSVDYIDRAVIAITRPLKCFCVTGSREVQFECIKNNIMHLLKIQSCVQFLQKDLV